MTLRSFAQCHGVRLAQERQINCRKFILLAVAIAAIHCVFSLTALAEFIPPDQTTASTPRYTGVDVKYPPGLYRYKVGWQGIEVGTAELSVSAPAATPKKEITFEARAKSSGVVKLFYELHHVSESMIQTAPFAPVQFSSRQIENTKAQYRTVKYDTDGTIHSRFWKPGKKAEEFTFQTNNLTLDPISSAILASSIPIEPGMEAAFDVYNGKHRFVIGFKVADKEEIKIEEKAYVAWRTVPNVTKLTDTKGEARLRTASIWIDANTHVILKLESKVLIGSISAVLETFEPLVIVPDVEKTKGALADPEKLPLETAQPATK